MGVLKRENTYEKILVLKNEIKVFSRLQVFNICTDQLTFIDKIVDYKHWFFGHYHFDRKIDDKKTCLYQEIVELK